MYVFVCLYELGDLVQLKASLFIGGVILFVLRIWILMNLLHYVNVIGGYLVSQVHWRQYVVKELLVKNQDYLNNIQLFNIHLISHYRHQVAICGGKEMNSQLTSQFLFYSFSSTFKMEKDDGTFIEVRIPPFNLECKSDPTDIKWLILLLLLLFYMHARVCVCVLFSKNNY